MKKNHPIAKGIPDFVNLIGSFVIAFATYTGMVLEDLVLHYDSADNGYYVAVCALFIYIYISITLLVVNNIGIRMGIQRLSMPTIFLS